MNTEYSTQRTVGNHQGLNNRGQIRLLPWYAMHQWLKNFSYRIQLSWWMFVGAGFLAVLIALITVSFQSIKAALANPENSLRTE